MRYRMRPEAVRAIFVTATQWHKNGDHPLDGNETYVDSLGKTQRAEGKFVRYFRHPEVPGSLICHQCGSSMHVHGWIDTPGDGHVVCPGSWVVFDAIKDDYVIYDNETFRDIYEPVEEEEQQHE